MKTRGLVFTIVALAFACGGNVSTGGDETSGGSGGNSGTGSGGKSGSGPGGKAGKGGAAGNGGQGGTGGTPVGCAPGATYGCLCPSGLDGYQVCRPDGAGYSDCICGGVGGCGSLDQCAAQSPWLTPECTSCVCSRCSCEMNDCMRDQGCAAIAQCASKFGCSGIGCYSPQTCQFVIDEQGGPVGVPASLALTLSDCSSASGCPCNVSGSGGAAGAGGAPAYCKCDGAEAVICSDGTAQDCAPYRCAPPGACYGTCNSNAECAPGFFCKQGGCY